ncbi:MAG: alpha/beta fold hydrolase [Deltaproteobacteria bacterium]|nr:MAG: alpha/beta fold hydrolase [Deltaproteobacteria bacterium]
MSFHGHWWTIWPHLRGTVAPPRPGVPVPFRTVVEDPKRGPVPLSGARYGEGRDLVVVVHGMGGRHDSAYVLRLVAALRRAGLAALAISLRGADGSGADFYHAGIVEDLAAVLAAPDLSGAERVAVAGFSLGGHVTLRFALAPTDPRVRAVAAICPPFELERTLAHIDAPRSYPYRRHLLAELVRMYAKVAARGNGPVPLSRAKRIRSIYRWDTEIVAPRFGFESAEHYYAETSVGPHLPEVRIPALVVAARHDPMVPLASLEPSLSRVRGSDRVDLRIVDRGGHVGFPASARLGDAPDGTHLYDDVAAWLRTRLSA